MAIPLRYPVLAALTLITAPGAMGASPLFTDNSVIPLIFELDFDDICRRPPAGGCPDAEGRIRYRAGDGTEVSLDVRYRTRGRWRRDTGNCSVPALFIRFDESQTPGTLFAGQTTLPFTSHCKHYKRTYHAWTILEYLAYRYYNLLSEASVRVRLARIDYRDAGSSRRYVRYGFFSEHFRELGERIGADWQNDVERVDIREADAGELATLSLYQYMIGHLDWSVIALHNVAAFRRPSGELVAVPFDFDYAGIVNTEYAAPPPGFGMESVRQRLYRGFCHPALDWEALFARFRELKPQFYELLEEQEGLGARDRRRARGFLDAFYRTLASEDLRRERIVEACRRLPN